MHEECGDQLAGAHPCACHVASTHIHLGGGELERPQRANQNDPQGRAAARRAAGDRLVHTQKDY